VNDIEPRLVRCFSAVFPGISGPQIKNASVETVETWDSIAMATLITAVEEEFSVEFDVDSLINLTSFESILGYLKQLKTTQIEGP
jgi:acyl carrier protein